jgi:uncharacterized protein DUF2442
MAKVKMNRWKYTERELGKMFDEATVRSRIASAVEPQAKSAHYDRATNRVVVELKNGATFIFPCKLAQGLSDESADDLALVELGPRGASLHWEKLDVDFSIVGLMSGVFGNKAWMSKLERNGGGGNRKPLVPGTRRARPSQELKQTSRRSKTAKPLRQDKAQDRT